MERLLCKMIFFAMLFAVLFGCSGGGGSDSSNSSNFITVSSDRLEFRTFETDTTYHTQNMTVHVEFEGDGVLVGYAPDVSPANWLVIQQSTITVSNKRFDLTIGCLPHVSQTTGTYTTTLRLLTGNSDGSNPYFVDLPVQLVIEDPPSVYDGDVISFAATTADTLPPLLQSISLDFGTFTGASFSVAIESVNSFAHDWVSANAVMEEEWLDVSIISNLPDGLYKANLIITYYAAGSSGKKSIPVEFTVTSTEPLIHYVSPPFSYIGQNGEFIIIGVGFTTETIQEITLGGVPATAFELMNNSEIRAQFPAFDSEGTHTLVLSTANGTYTGPTEIVVKQQVDAVYTNLDIGSEVRDFEFDAMRDMLIAATSTGMYKIQNTGSSWQTVTQRNIDVRSFDLTPDGNHLVYSDGSQLYLLDARTLTVAASYDFPALDTSGGAASYSYARIKHVLCNGDVLLALSTANRETYCIFHLPNQIFTRSDYRSESNITRISFNRQKSIIVPNAIVSNFSGYYMASSQTYVFVTLPRDTIPANRFALSGNGERIYLWDGIYDSEINYLNSITDSSVLNYSTELSFDGNTAYWIEASEGEIHTYDVTASPASKIGIISFPGPYASYVALPETRITPDGEMMILGKGMRSGTTPETRLVFVPLSPI